MCGILGGSGKASNGKYVGIAPGVKLICAKVLNEKGKGDLMYLIQGLAWIISLLSKYPIKIINISLEIGKHQDGTNQEELHILHKLINGLWEKGVLVIMAAGNAGPKSGTISSIADGNACICVACHDAEYVGKSGYNCSKFSGKGPGKNVLVSSFYNPMRKPDIVAPGSDIISCNAFYAKRYQGFYISKSGTSMAAPQISGACALFLQKYPNSTNNEIRNKLYQSARDLQEPWYIQGAGMLQIDVFLNI